MIARRRTVTDAWEGPRLLPEKGERLERGSLRLAVNEEGVDREGMQSSSEDVTTASFCALRPSVATHRL